MKVIKTYNDAVLSGVPLILKLQNILGLYAYIKVYPTISAVIEATSDSFTTNLKALNNSTLSKECIVGFIVTGGMAYFTKAYRTISSDVQAYTGKIATLQIHLDGYLSGIPRIAVIYINNIPYYYKVYPTMISRVIADALDKVTHDIQGAEQLYISIINNPVENNFPIMTSGGELQSSRYNSNSFDLSGTSSTHAVLTTTAHGLGASAFHADSYFSLSSHNHDTRYYIESEIDTLLNNKSNTSHKHTGVYDPINTASGLISSHNFTYNHSNIHALHADDQDLSGYSLSSHKHTGVYDPIGTGHSEASTHVSSHESTYSHSNYNTAYTDRMKWNGGNTGLIASTGRTSLGLGSAATQNTTAFDASGTASNLIGIHESIYNHINYNTAYNHISNINNPHSVTKSQVGLGSVENTALSTWVGSTNITTLGKIVLNTSIVATSGTGKAFTLQNVLISSDNNNYLHGLYINPTATIMGHTGVKVFGISVPNISVSGSPAPQYKQGITVDEQTGATNNWGIVDYNNAYFEGNVSAASFTDRTPSFNGDGLEAIKNIKSKDGKIDHESLPEISKMCIPATQSVDENGNIINKTEEYTGRSIGGSISVLEKAVKQLLERVEDLEKENNELRGLIKLGGK